MSAPIPKTPGELLDRAMRYRTPAGGLRWQGVLRGGFLWLYLSEDGGLSGSVTHAHDSEPYLHLNAPTARLGFSTGNAFGMGVVNMVEQAIAHGLTFPEHEALIRGFVGLVTKETPA